MNELSSVTWMVD